MQERRAKCFLHAAQSTTKTRIHDDNNNNKQRRARSTSKIFVCFAFLLLFLLSDSYFIADLSNSYNYCENKIQLIHKLNDHP